jgi:hypothetical protein
MWVLAGVGLVGIIATTLKVLFGSYSLPHIMREYSKQKQIDQTYEQMFRSRDNFCYHISASLARGENEDARRLAVEVKALDKQIEEMEVKHFGRKVNATKIR